MSSGRPSAVPHLACLQGFGTTIFAEMSALAVATGSINLGQGFPDTDGPREVADAAVAAIRAGHNQYPPGPASPSCAHAIADHQRRWYGIELDPDTEVLVTAGATEAIAAALLALCEPGDEVVTFEPYYDSYAACIALAGAQRRVVHARSRPTTASIPTSSRRAITPRTRLLLLNSPHNPTGKVFTRRRARGDRARCASSTTSSRSPTRSTSTSCSTGEHIPLATLPGMRERTLTISSGGKTFSFTGWKIGWVCGPAPLVDRGAHREAVPHLRERRHRSSTRSRSGLGLDDDYFPDLAADMRDKRDRLVRRPRDGRASRCCPSAGTYFVTVDIRRSASDDGLAFCRCAARAVRRGRGAQRRVLRRPRRGPAARALRVLQARRGDRRGRRRG